MPPTDPYEKWKSDGDTGYEETLTSPGGWLWRYAGNPDSRSLPTLKTLRAGLAVLGLLAGTAFIGESSKEASDDFRRTLTQPEGSRDPVQELYERIMALAESRAKAGLPNPTEVSVTVNPHEGTISVLGKEIKSEKK